MSLDISVGSLHNQSYIELAYHVKGKGATPLAESTVVPVPLNLRKPIYRMAQTGSVIDPARDIVEGANRSLWCADWIYTTDDRLAFSVQALDMPLISIGSTGIYRFEPERVPKESTVYAHLSNTQWGTNFPQWLEGDFSWRVRLFPDHHGWQWGGMSPMGSLSEEDREFEHRWYNLFRVQFADVISVHPRHDGAGLIVRLCERNGKHRTAWLQSSAPISAIWHCDLLERPIEQLELAYEMGKSLDVPLNMKPHSIETILIEFDPTKKVEEE
nr:Unknown Function [uncultured bacterium]